MEAGSGGEHTWGGQGVGDVVSHGRRPRDRNFVCSQYLAFVSAALSFGTNVFVSISCDSFLLRLYARFDYS